MITTSNPVRILVAEDSATQRAQICIVLEKLSCEVQAVSNGREALAVAQEFKPDVLLTDVNMPEIGGYELCRRIKDHPTLHNTAVILVTMLADPVDVIRGLEAGADNFIVKPYREDYLLARVNHMISNRQLRTDTHRADIDIQITFAGQRFVINSDRLQILNLLLSSYETAVQRNVALVEAQDELRALTESLEQRVTERTAELEAEMLKSALAEQAVHKQATILQSVIHSMGDGLVVASTRDEFVLINPAAEELLGPLVPGGKTPECTSFKPDLITPIPPDELPLYRALDGHSSDNVEVFARTVTHPEGVMLSATARPIRDASGAISGAVVAMRNITAQKQMEDHILRNQRMDSIGSLAGGIAHDLNNVLAPILMASELLMLSETDPSSRSILQTIHQSAHRGARLIKQLLTFARGTGEAAHKLVELGPMIEQLQKVLGQTFPSNITIQLNVASDLSPILADDTQIDQVLLNLCVNARDAMPDGGVISISVANVTIDELQASGRQDAKPGPYLQLAVGDTGTGISQAVLDRMYEPFFTTKPPGKGTGLGLSTILGIIKAHGGFIEVKTKVGQGTVFNVFLPAQPPANAVVKDVDETTLFRGHNECVLIIDDEEAIRLTAGTTLKQYGYRVHAAEDGVSAIAWFAQHHTEVDVVLIDMKMPLMDGITTLQALRKISSNFGAAMISGHEESVDTKALARMEVAQILLKPYSIQSLLRTVHLLLKPKDTSSRFEPRQALAFNGSRHHEN
jgi:signal transduction histidine kinase/DNA-binding response OmpR family regulator